MRTTDLTADHSETDPLHIEAARIEDAYARRNPGDRYSWFQPGHVFMMQERERGILSLLQRYQFHNLETKRILDVGCGTGNWLRDLIRWGAEPRNIGAVELLEERVARARQLCPFGVEIRQNTAAQLPYGKETFDMVIQSTVFTSILDGGMKQQIASEMLRVLKPEGFILWYDFLVNNPRNPDVRGVPRMEIQSLFPGCDVRLKRITLAPPLTRRVAPYSWLVCYLLSKVPFLCTHYLGVIRKG